MNHFSKNTSEGIEIRIPSIAFLIDLDKFSRKIDRKTHESFYCKVHQKRIVLECYSLGGVSFGTPNFEAVFKTCCNEAFEKTYQFIITTAEQVDNQNN